MGTFLTSVANPNKQGAMPGGLPKPKRIGEKEYQLDARGYACPLPSLASIRALEELEEGAVLHVLVDDPTSCETVPNSVRDKGHELLSIEKLKSAPNEYKITVRKRGSQ